jgi:hypothetical protein
VAGTDALQVKLKICAKESHLHGVLEKKSPCRGRFEGTSANQQDRSGERLKCPESLRDGRLRDVQAFCRFIETAFFNNGSQTFKKVGGKYVHGVERYPEAFLILAKLIKIKQN